MGKNQGKKRQREADDVAAAAEDTGGAARAEKEADAPRAKKARVETNRSLFVRSLPATATDDTLTDFFSQHFPVKHATVVLDPKTKTSRGYGFVTFTDPEDALEAKQKLDSELFGGRRLRLDVAEPRNRDAAKKSAVSKSSAATRLASASAKREREEALAEAKRPPKLIIRNLPWSIKSSEQLSKLFQGFGKVKFADLPQNKGKLSGFGFVTLRGRENAGKAMEAINGRVVDGRTLAVDWAVDKNTWQKEQGKEQQHEEEADKVRDAPKSNKQKRQKKASDGADGDANQSGKSQEELDLENFFKDHMENLESEEESDPEAIDEDDEDGDNISEQSNEDEGEGEEEIEDDIDETDLEDEDDEDDVAEEHPEHPRKLTDNSTTIFVRNLPYTTSNETLKAHFSKFGPVRYARVVMERATDRPAGTGFVCFVHTDNFQACLKAAPHHLPLPALGKHSLLQDESLDKDGRYTLDGRVLQVSQAVSKEQATLLAANGPDQKNQAKDRRRLFLLSEGAIPASSPVFAKLAPSEIKMREASAKQRKKLIQSNPALHLSLTRLALRNIPRNVGSKELKALAREAIVGFAMDVREGRRQPLSKEERARGGQEDKEAEHRRKEKKKGVVRQAKIVFETTEGSKVAEGTGAGKSRGYGFIEYSSHRCALMGLRWLNGHALANDAGKTQRLIAEFAIENANVVQRRRQLGEMGKTRPGPRQNEQQQQQVVGRGDGALSGEKTKGKKQGREGGRRGDDDGEDRKGLKGAKGKKGQGGKGKGRAGGDDEAGSDDEGPAPKKMGKKSADEKLASRTRIIVRKRQLRKMKRGKARGGK